MPGRQESRNVTDDANASRVERIADLAVDLELRVATAESLTSGTVAKTLGAGPNAADWFVGGVVAYQEPVKFDVLGVREGPVVTAECAEQMATGARKLLGADVVVSATGVGGPDPSEGKPAGTVFVAVARGDDVAVEELALDGDPEEVLSGTVSRCLGLLEQTLHTD
jgi:nicotinamide-nucleotide amidase